MSLFQKELECHFFKKMLEKKTDWKELILWVLLPNMLTGSFTIFIGGAIFKVIKPLFNSIAWRDATMLWLYYIGLQTLLSWSSN